MSKHEDRQRALSPERGRVVPKKLAHIVRRTSRAREMIDWYCNVFGAEVVHSTDMLTFLTFDDEHHRFAIVNLPGLEEQSMMAAGTDHVAFTYADLGDLLYNYARLKKSGIEPYWCVNHGMTISMYYKDPDGNRVEFQVDAMASADTMNQWMRGGDFAANPIGVVFDPEDLLARYRAGEAMESLVFRPTLPEGVTPADMLRF